MTNGRPMARAANIAFSMVVSSKVDQACLHVRAALRQEHAKAPDYSARPPAGLAFSWGSRRPVHERKIALEPGVQAVDRRRIEDPVTAVPAGLPRPAGVASFSRRPGRPSRRPTRTVMVSGGRSGMD